MTGRTKIILDESELPRQWYNIVPDLPSPPPPPLHPGTLQPVGPEDLAPLFPMALIAQEVTADSYVPPVWPAGPGDRQMLMHLDIEVDDLDAAGAHAVATGATLAEFQPQDDVRVFLDPAGHPFCLFLPG